MTPVVTRAGTNMGDGLSSNCCPDLAIHGHRALPNFMPWYVRAGTPPILGVFGVHFMREHA